MAESTQHNHFASWKPTPAHIPDAWSSFLQRLEKHARGRPRPQHAYVLNVKYNASLVGQRLHIWGLPWQIVAAGSMISYNIPKTRMNNLLDKDQVLVYRREALYYLQCIEDDNLFTLLNPPYQNLGGLLIALAIYATVFSQQAEQTERNISSHEDDIRRENAGQTLLHIAKRLGMWYFKRELEDLLARIRDPQQFATDQQEHTRLLAQDQTKLQRLQHLFSTFYEETARQDISVDYVPPGITGLKRRQQDTSTTVTPQKLPSVGIDLVNFDIAVPTVQDCYAAFGIFSQLGYIQDRVIDQIANPKANGYSYLAFHLTLNGQHPLFKQLTWLSQGNYRCLLQIATGVMQAIMRYGCLYPRCYELYTQPIKQENERNETGYWQSTEGNVFTAISTAILHHIQPLARPDKPIIVYDKQRHYVALPKGATALDFAYEIDSELGEKAAEAFVNDRKVALKHVLDAGDIVEIRTVKETLVQEHWLTEAYAITPKAQRHIKALLNRRHLEQRGFDLVRAALARQHYHPSLEELDDLLRTLLHEHTLGTRHSYLEQIPEHGVAPYSAEWAAKHIVALLRGRNASPPATQTYLPLAPRMTILKNPFNISRPALPEMFFGRVDEMKQMYHVLCAPDYGKALLLYGPRRSGKSSLCKNFLERYIQAPYYATFYSLQGASELTEEQILQQIAERINQAFAEEPYYQGVRWEELAEKDPQQRFQQLVLHYLNQQPGTRLLLALDEFGGALRSYEQHILKQRFFTYWRDLIGNLPQLSLLLILPTSSHRQLTQGPLSNAFSFAEPLELPFLDEQSAQRLLEEPLREQQIALSPKTLTRAVKLTGGNPYYMNLLGLQLIHHLNLMPSKQLLEEGELEQVVAYILDMKSPQNFDFYAEELQDPNEWRTLQAIIEITAQSNVPAVSQTDLFKHLHLPTREIIASLQRLRNGSILEEFEAESAQPQYAFKVELVWRWMLRNRWFFNE